jgi:tetratricopeptide (TPR) repeat protein
MRPIADANRRTAAAAAFVVLATILAFLPVLGNGWIGNWDESVVLLSNPFYRGLDPARLRWMFTTFHADQYQPLTWLAYACDYLLWGMNPAGYHAASLALHAANAGLYFLLARRLLAAAAGDSALGPETEAAFAALLFSLHPLRVEPVAWAAGLHDVLAGFFFLAALLAYLRAQREPSARVRWLCAAWGAFALSLLSKAAGLCLPLVLLVLDWYPGRRFATRAAVREAIMEKLPFAALSLAAGAVLAAAQSGAVRPLRNDITPERLEQAVYGLTFYLGKTLFPSGLTPFYEIPARWNRMEARWLLCAAFVGLFSILAARLRRDLPGLLAAWLCYALTLLPMLGLATATYQLAADRYSYLSCLCWPLLAAGALRELIRRAGKVSAMSLAAALVAVLGVLTWRQSLLWRSPETLWTHTVAIEPDSATAQINLGVVLAGQRRLDEAIAHFQTALDLNPVCIAAQDRLAAIFSDRPRADKAARLRGLLMVNPACLAAYGNLISAKASRGEDLPRAEAYYRQLLSLGLRRPDLTENLEKVLRAEASAPKK